VYVRLVVPIGVDDEFPEERSVLPDDADVVVGDELPARNRACIRRSTGV
jgi:hypothetical protein